MKAPRLGWDETWERARRELDPEGAWTPVRVAAEHRGAYHAIVATDGAATDGAATDDEPSAGAPSTAWVELAGRTFHRARDKRALPVVGDWVLVERWDEAVAGKGAAVVRAILPRRGLLVRKAAGEATAPQPLVANADVGIVLTSANKDLSPARLDRYLSLLRDGGIPPALVLTKVDLAADPEPALATLRALAPEAAVLATSAVTGAGIDAVRALAGPGRTAVLLGSSGVGKSSLLNAMLGTAQLTQPIRGDERGRHTTTRRELFVAEDGGLWIDTPGMRELAQWIDDAEAGAADEAALAEIAALAHGCRFRDCQHQAEPGCAVRAAVENGTLPAARLASFHKLTSERATGAARQEAARRIAESRRARTRRTAPGRDGGSDDDR